MSRGKIDFKIDEISFKEFSAYDFKDASYHIMQKSGWSGKNVRTLTEILEAQKSLESPFSTTLFCMYSQRLSVYMYFYIKEHSVKTFSAHFNDSPPTLHEDFYRFVYDSYDNGCNDIETIMEMYVL